MSNIVRTTRLNALLERHTRAHATGVAAVLMVASLLVVSSAVAPTDHDSVITGQAIGADGSLEGVGSTDDTQVLGDTVERDAAGNPVVATADGTAVTGAVPRGTAPRPGTPTTVETNTRVVTGTLPPGVTDDEILLAYYWKGDRTMSSPYVQGSGQEGNLDEGEAFMRLIDYINAHPNGDATFMGLRFNLHGRKLRGVVLEAGQYPDTYAATAEKLAREIKPFAALAAHGSLSVYICPRLAKAGIHNLDTYDLGGNLFNSTNGYCLPAGMSWEKQVDFSVSYLLKQSKTTTYSTGPATSEPRVYGMVYVEYPGLVDSAPKLAQKLRDAGLPLKEVASLASDLGTSQQQAPNVVAKMRAAGVNTLIFPDAGGPLNFTHSAQANGYNPDYFIWPCSGQDTTGMVRLYNAGQWARASGLTCYDREFNPDLTNDDKARQTEWYRQYQEAAGPNNEPPATTSLVYAGLHEVLVGITNAGPNLSVENFRTGLKKFQPYRYNAISGVTDNPANLLLTLNDSGHSPIGDVARLSWSPSTVSPGSAAPGAYVYPESRRYSRTDEF